MFLASADYPNSAISALEMMVIAFVMASGLAIWLGMVFIADRRPRKQAEQAHSYTAVVAAPGQTAEDGPIEPSHSHGAAA